MLIRGEPAAALHVKEGEVVLGERAALIGCELIEPSGFPFVDRQPAKTVRIEMTKVVLGSGEPLIGSEFV